MEGASGNTDIELLSRTLQVEHKLFYFDFKENPRGRYLKICEKTSGTRSTIIVPVAGIVWFVDLFNYYVNGDDPEILSKELQLDAKVFYFDVGENKRGRFLKVCEASVTRSRSTIIVPAGSAAGDGWAAFRNILVEINEASQLSVFPTSSMSSQQAAGLSDTLEELSDEVGADFRLGGSTQVMPRDDPEGDRSTGLTTVDEMGEMAFSKVIRADQKKFFFDLGSNPRGQFLRISEVTGADRSVIILPVSALEQFHNVLGQFVDITRSQGVAGSSVANVRTIAPPQR